MNRITVSLCILTHNNETTIGMTIKSVLALVDEVIVVDLYSSDNTRVVAEGYGAMVIKYEFNNNYAAAKNVALKEAVCNWILWLNPNEILFPVSPREFQDLLKTNISGYKIAIVSEDIPEFTTPKEELRLFRYHPKVKYQYPARERIEPSLHKHCPNATIENTDDIKILQDNKEPIGISSKSSHIVSILQKGIIDNPSDPYLEYAIACEYITMSEGEIIPNSALSISIDALEKSWKKYLVLDNDSRKNLDYLSDLMLKLSACYLASGKIQLARQIIEKAKRLFPEDQSTMLQYLAIEIVYLRNIITDNKSVEAKNWERKLLALIDLLQKFDIQPSHLIKYKGDLALIMGDVRKAERCFKLALDMDSNYSYALLGLAQCQLYLGYKKRAIVLYMAATRKNEHNCLAWSEGSKLLEEIGFTDNASNWCDIISTRFPCFQESKAND